MCKRFLLNGVLWPISKGEGSLKNARGFLPKPSQHPEMKLSSNEDAPLDISETSGFPHLKENKWRFKKSPLLSNYNSIEESKILRFLKQDSFFFVHLSSCIELLAVLNFLFITFWRILIIIKQRKTDTTTQQYKKWEGHW